MCAGEHGCGGRLATRTSTDASLRDAPEALRGGGALLFDHAAQFFTAVDPWFAALVDTWRQRGLVHDWAGPVVTIGADGVAQSAGTAAKHVAAGGMRALAEQLRADAEAAGARVRRPCWVAGMRADEAEGWRLRGNSKAVRGLERDLYDFVVIAHNGKCADRLLRPAGVPLVAAQMRALKLSAVWVAMVAFRGAVATPGGFEGAFVAGSDSLAWAGNNTAKLRRSGAGGAELECWTLTSTPAYGKRNKVPQENVPPEVAEKVRCLPVPTVWRERRACCKAQTFAAAAQVQADLLAAFATAVGGPLPEVAFQKCQLWGAALPLNTPASSCVFDASGRVGICGDWLRGSSMEAAALSGRDLARHLRRVCDSVGAVDSKLDVGLRAPLGRIDAPAIGDVDLQAGEVASRAIAAVA